MALPAELQTRIRIEAHEDRPLSSISSVEEAMRQAQFRLMIPTHGKGLVEFTSAVVDWVAAQGIDTGLLTLFCRHTSASLTIQENADPTVRQDIARYFETLAPEQAGRYCHEDEGLDDMPAHLRTMLTDTSLTIPVADGRPVLGNWQGLYVFEHRRHAHRREIVLHLMGE
jgi:secondary thiamine-phosphate synthase enzyme